MSSTSALIDATPAQIFAVLSDGWNYADWVVGAVHVRAVDPQWPEAGSRVHHKVGAWPFMIADSTSVLASDPDGRLELKARLWPLGEAHVDIRWDAEDSGRTRVTINEQFADGPLLALRNRLNDVALHQRNREALRRLADMTRRYAGQPDERPVG